MNVTLLVVNYNLPEAVNVLINSMAELNRWLIGDWLIVDNGSEQDFIHPWTDIRVAANDQWMSGLIPGLEAVKTEFVWVFTTSMGEIKCAGDPVESMLSLFAEDVVCVMAAFTGEIKSAAHAERRVTDEPYREARWGGPCGMWRTEWLRSHIDPRMKSGWGVDFELGYLARQEGKRLLVNNKVQIELLEHNGYPERRPTALEDVNYAASQNMNEVLTEKYGPGWKQVLGVDI